MFPRRDIVRRGVLAVVMLTAAQGAWAQEKKMNLFKVITVKDEIVIGIPTMNSRKSTARTPAASPRC